MLIGAGSAMLSLYSSHQIERRARLRADTMFGDDQVTYNVREYLRSPIAPAKPSKCGGCGSHEYVAHDGRQVCSYCRIPASR